jgi:hypothetical protein
MSQYPGKVFIDVWDCRAMVAQYRAVEGKPGSSTWERASNWEDLADAAAAAVDDQGGYINQSGHYACPSDLADRAVFDSD